MPHHVAQEWIDKNKGRFDDGWDKYREHAFTLQKKLGVIPKRRSCIWGSKSAIR